MKTNKSLKAGFTLVEIMIVVAIIGLLVAMAVPNFVKARTLSQKSACQNNLSQIRTAKSTWALEMQKGGADVPVAADLYGASLYIAVQPKCPSTGLTASYAILAVDTLPTCTQNTAPNLHIITQ